MAATVRTESIDVARSPLGERLRADPWAFNFFQAVRLLRRFQPDRAPVGAFARPSDEPVRFSVNPSLAFPASQIQSFVWTDGSQPRMTVNFMGLVGPLGVLPNYYTEWMAGRVRARDFGARDFFDIFHHRMLSLFYRAWETYHFGAGCERQEDSLAQVVLDLIGNGTPGLQRRLPISDVTLVYYSGLLATAPRSAAALEALLADYFDVPVEVEQFVGVWRNLGSQDWCCLDAGDEESRSLGCGAVVGDEVWDQQSRVRIRLGPLTAAKYKEFLPTGSAYEPLRALTRTFGGNDIEFEAQLMLMRDETPACELGGETEAAQLGWFTWLHSQPHFDRDAKDTVLLLT